LFGRNRLSGQLHPPEEGVIRHGPHGPSGTLGSSLGTDPRDVLGAVAGRSPGVTFRCRYVAAAARLLTCSDTADAVDIHGPVTNGGAGSHWGKQ